MSLVFTRRLAESCCRGFSSLLLCPLFVDRYYFPLFVNIYCTNLTISAAQNEFVTEYLIVSVVKFDRIYKTPL